MPKNTKILGLWKSLHQIWDLNVQLFGDKFNINENNSLPYSSLTTLIWCVHQCPQVNNSWKYSGKSNMWGRKMQRTVYSCSKKNYNTSWISIQFSWDHMELRLVTGLVQALAVKIASFDCSKDTPPPALEDQSSTQSRLRPERPRLTRPNIPARSCRTLTQTNWEWKDNWKDENPGTPRHKNLITRKIKILEHPDTKNEIGKVKILPHPDKRSR